MSRLAGFNPLTAIGLALVALLAVWLIVNLVKTPELFLQAFLIGFTRGAIYALIALGYTLVYGILELINFAHGDVFMLGGMIVDHAHLRGLRADAERLRARDLVVASWPRSRSRWWPAA